MVNLNDDVIDIVIREAIMSGCSLAGVDDAPFCDNWPEVREELESVTNNSSGITKLFFRGLIIVGDKHCES